MKLTKKLEAEILKLYLAYWDAYLKGDMKTFASFFDENMTVFGTAASEVFTSKKEAVEFYKATADQMTGKADFRNRNISVKPVGDTIVINDQSQLYVLIDELWTFYGHARISAIFEQKNNLWKLVHQHGSFPDSRTEEGEQIATEKIKEENLQLRDAVKRRTVELEQNNKELEIETSLERVRAEAMGMKKPDDILAICKVMFKELQMLGFPQLRNTLINFWDDERSSLIDYDYSDETGGNKANLPYSSHPVFEQFQKTIKNSKDAFAELVVTNEQLESWKQRRRDSGEYEDARLNNISALYYYFYSIGVGAIGISTFSPITEVQLNVLKRFRNVFDFSYRRYADVAQAEAQAKESQIELGLERVRARAMAMQNSDELAELVSVLLRELTNLDFSLTSCIIWINDHDHSSNTLWIASAEMNKPAEPVQLKPFQHDFFHSIIHAWKEKDPKWIYTLTGKEKTSFEKAFFANEPNMPVALKNALSIPEKVVFSASFNNFGALEILGTEALTDDKFSILHRFGKVFDSSYTRFNDLKKAEAQAKEAQIETALERVRSQSMGMQTSKDLSNVTTAMFEQLRMLGGELYATGIVFCDKHEHHVEQWHSVPGAGMLSPFIVPVDLDNIHQYRYDQWKEGVELFSVEIPADFIVQHFESIFNLPTVKAVLDDFAAKNIAMPETPSWEIDYGASFRHGYILVSALQPFSNADILPRFAKVFEQTYTRFLDLQKAEAQAREATIEASLEKVRGKAMAMHNSDDLSVTVSMVFTELRKLDINPIRCGVGLLTKESKKSKLYAATSSANGDSLSLVGWAELSGHPVLEKIYDIWLKKEDYFPELTGEQLHSYYSLLLKGLPVALPNFINGEKQYGNFLSFSFGCLYAWSANPYNDSELKILKRFAAIVDLTFRRYIDLQKAEAQTREAQIELGLERVRARAMAMQKSDELSELVDTVFKELTKLDFALNWCIINIIDAPSLTNMVWAANPETNKPPESYLMKFEDYPFHHSMMKGYQERKTKHVYVIEGKEKTTYDNYLFNETEWRRVPKAAQDASRAMKRYVATFTFSNFGGLQTVGEEYLSEENLDILSRFGKVFDLTYTRFNDLQKAEAQAKEAQIEAALERVRSRSMGMQKSEELKEVIKIVYQQLRHLKINLDHAGFVVDYKPKADWNFWIADEQDIPSKITHPYFESVWATQFNEAKEKGADFFATHLNFEEKNKFYNELLSYVPGLPKASKDFYLNCPALAATTVVFDSVSLYIENFSGIPYADEENKILMRFGKVFQQTYTRFLDLQKAEAQAREAQIEMALERVRSRSLAMHSSGELGEVVTVVLNNLTELGYIIDQGGAAHLAIFSEGTKDFFQWTADPSLPHPVRSFIPYTDLPILSEFWDARQKGRDFFANVYSFEEKNTWFNYAFEHSDLKHVPGELKKLLLESETYAHSIAIEKNSAIIINSITGNQLSENQIDILRRFSKVFEQAYVRFLDLQKAESQAREAQIETALERVRAVAMSMMKSDDLLTICQSVFTQLQVLGFENIRAAQIYIRNDEEEKFMNYDYALVTGAVKVEVNYNSHPNTRRIYDVIRNAGDGLVYNVIEKEKLEEWKSYLYNTLRQQPEENLNAADGLHYYLYSFGIGAFGICTFKAISPEELDILKRFRNVFNLSYQRYADIALAEAQLREAQIETSLERVRSKTMAMHNSEDVGETVATLFDELEKLGVYTNRCGILINSEETMEAEVWTAKSNPSGKANLIIGQLDLTMHPLLQGIYHAWKSKKPVFNYTMLGNDLKSYYQAINNTKYYPTQFDMDVLPAKEFHTDFYFAEGSIFAFTSESITEEAAAIFKRFANVFGQTYRRYLDLQKAELQTHKANIETALERVRARALAMQQPEELTEVAQVMRHEMGLLGVEELETSSIYIHEEASENAECWYAIKDSKVPEKKLVSDHFKLQLNDTCVGQQMHAFYHSNKKQISIPMQGANRKEWIDYCSKQSKLLDGFYGDVIPNRTYHLYKFSNGTIGAATPGNISAESWDLLQRAASVFSLAYSRFKDLTQARIDLLKLKEEKQRAEDALTELQATQKQLIQSEKMASLGELTAGIAHEIQNPLNFVNNFSEVSSELIKEMVEEVDKGNTEEVKAIANDVVQNLEKINHHGKRAADIVKGMLEHSRSSSGVKVPTNINALADEYLRLAYHGLRAKDKSFNATMKTEFDETIGNINIIPQDIGRVVLNLITNAFYVVNEKKTLRQAQGDNSYEPTVSVSTKKINGKIEIKVADNGNGIPQKILDKIFQPFFTTKPTGQGTGLGLSLSYDIVKAHGGELKVETKPARAGSDGEGEGSEFVIQLPSN